MKRIFQHIVLGVSLTCALFGTGHAQSVPEEKKTDKNMVQPDYTQFLPNTFSLQDLRVGALPQGKWPIMSVINVAELKKYQQNEKECTQRRVKGEGYDNQNCPKYEYVVPYTTVDVSQQVARQLRQKWQEFEDRYYWRTMVQLNNPEYYLMYCFVGFNSGLTTDTPKAFINFLPAMVPQVLQEKFKDYTRLDEPGFHLDGMDYQSVLPNVQKEKFCDDLSMAFSIMYLPGTCWDQRLVGYTRVCIEGSVGLNQPHPLWFNQGEAEWRVRQAIERAHTVYLPQYHAEVAKLLTPGVAHPLWAPLWWKFGLSTGDSVLQPVANASMDVSQLVDVAKRARAALGKSNPDENSKSIDLSQQLAEQYYWQNEWFRSPLLDGLLLPGTKNVQKSPPAAWKLEEMKRTMPPNNIRFYEQVGYASFFQAWNALDRAVLPEDDNQKPFRQILYWATGTIEDTHWGTCWAGPFPYPCPETTVTVVPVPIPVAPYLTPFAGPRTHFAWISVPEGYAIPRTNSGPPAWDYWEFLK